MHANLLPIAALAAAANASGAELDWLTALPPHAAPASLLLCVVVCTCLLLCAPATVVCACLLLKIVFAENTTRAAVQGCIKLQTMLKGTCINLPAWDILRDGYSWWCKHAWRRLPEAWNIFS